MKIYAICFVTYYMKLAEYSGNKKAIPNGIAFCQFVIVSFYEYIFSFNAFISSDVIYSS